MSDRVQVTLVGLYVFGWFIDWTYWIATGGIDLEESLVSGIIGGFFLGFFWPLHIGVEVWKMII